MEKIAGKIHDFPGPEEEKWRKIGRKASSEVKTAFGGHFGDLGIILEVKKEVKN